MACEPNRNIFFSKLAHLTGLPAEQIETAYQAGRNQRACAQPAAAVEEKMQRIFDLMQQLGYPPPTYYEEEGIPQTGGKVLIPQQACSPGICRCVRPALGYAAVYDWISSRTSKVSNSSNPAGAACPRQAMGH
jgi:hypothetical protein